MRKKAEESLSMADSLEEVKKKSARDADALQQRIETLAAENDKLNKSKKKFESEVSLLGLCDSYLRDWLKMTLCIFAAMKRLLM